MIELQNHDKHQGYFYDSMEQVSDGYHTFRELYEFRLLYNAALFNEWAKQGLYEVHKSWYHADDPTKPIYGGTWFVVVAELPTGQISNHYPMKDWKLFDIPEARVAHAFDGHTPAGVAQRLRNLLRLTDEPTN